MEAFIIRYGAVAIVLGAGIEGEPFALAGGLLAHRRLISWWDAAGAAAVGSCLVDQLWFHLARFLRSSRPVASVARRPAFARAMATLERHPVWFVLLFRFAYGLRAVAPVAIGVSQVPERVFVPLNLIAAAWWGLMFTTGGYLLGPAVEILSQRFGRELAVGAVAVSLGALALTLRKGPPA